MPRISPQIVVISTVSVIIQIALAILAWGDWSSFFAHPARTWLAIGSFLLLVLAWFSGTSGLSGGETPFFREQDYPLWIRLGDLRFGGNPALLRSPQYLDSRWRFSAVYRPDSFLCRKHSQVSSCLCPGTSVQRTSSYSARSPIKNGRALPVYPSPQLRRAPHLDDRFGLDLSQHHRPDIEHLPFHAPPEPDE
jgi:hypothetical protein